MKKYLVIGLSVLILMTVLTSATMAQTAQRPSKFAITVGGNTDDGFEYFYWSVGGEMHLFLGENMMIAPEVMLVGYKFDFDYLVLYPGGTFNLLFGKPGNQFFAGGGLLLGLPIEPSGLDSELMIKLNGGILCKSYKITGYLMTPLDDFFGNFVIGAYFGFIL